MSTKKRTATGFAILAALLFGICSPVAKILLMKIPPSMMAALLYLGAGIGISGISLLRRVKTGKRAQERITRGDAPFVLAMIALDIAAALLLMAGLTLTTAANVSLLSNFEIAATALVALLLFREAVGRRLWLAVFLITVSSILLSVEGGASFSFSPGSALVLLACVCWGFENNCTKQLSARNPMQVVIFKGFGCGTGSLLIALLQGQRTGSAVYILLALVLGFFSYGLSVFFYVSAQRELGAARTSAYFALAPFVGVGLSIAVFRAAPTIPFLISLPVMAAGVVFASTEKRGHVDSAPGNNT